MELWALGAKSSRAMATLRAWHLLPSQTVASCHSIKPGATCGLNAEFLKLETSSRSHSYSLELVTIAVTHVCVTSWGCSSSTVWAQPQHPSLAPTEAGRGAGPGGPTGAPSGLCQGGSS